MRRIASAVAALALAVSACGDSSAGGSLFVQIASSPNSIGTGIQRVMLALIELETGEFQASPFLDANVTVRDENGAPIETLEADFLWLIPNVRGLYVIYPEFPEEGLYQLTVDVGTSELGPFGINVVADPMVIARGDVAPLSETRTLADHDVSEISSDPDPDLSFYELSIRDAVLSGPTVIVFATPKWCRTSTCGPLLDQVKELSSAFPDLNFVHVEVYDDIQVASFDDLEAVPAVEEWGLPSEPWVFVVNADGVVAASFEGAASGEELVSAFLSVSP
ncbi:MAG: thioredoxin family protein [Acidimicrobiia bacterium]|nr:thioredoxin family protein [Acidimicrobiia bacterium]